MAFSVELDQILKEKLKQICFDCIDNLDVNSEFEVSKIECGVSNQIYKCSFKHGQNTETFVVRIFGTNLIKNLIDNIDQQDSSSDTLVKKETTAAIITDTISRSGICPKLLAVFNGGRVEEFISGRNVVFEDFTDKSLYSTIAKKLARFHSAAVPVRRRPMIFENNPMFGVTVDPDFTSIDEKYHQVIKQLIDFPLESELNWTLKISPKLNSPIVFSHNDLHLNNIILRDHFENEDDRIVFVDFDMSGYNYRGYDFAIFLHTLHEFHVFITKDSVLIKYTGSSCSDEIRHYFVEEYLRELKHCKENFDNAVDNYDHMKMEIDFFNIQHYLIFILFTKILFLDTKRTTYDHIEPLLRLYSEQKEEFLKNYAQIL